MKSVAGYQEARLASRVRMDLSLCPQTPETLSAGTVDLERHKGRECRPLVREQCERAAQGWADGGCLARLGFKQQQAQCRRYCVMMMRVSLLLSEGSLFCSPTRDCNILHSFCVCMSVYRQLFVPGEIKYS